MSIPLEPVVGELYITQGVPQSVTRPTAALVPPRHAARGREGERLFILVELRGPEPLPYEALIDRIEATYWRTPGSVTAALRAAVVVTNDWLMDRNVQAEVADRVRAGVSCAALRVREAEVYIAQAGPAAALVAHHGQVERFPAGDATPMAMGASRGVEVRFSHAALSPGDVLLLCDSATAERISDEAVTSAIVYTGVEAALQNLAKLAGSADLIALAMEAVAEARTKAAVRSAVEAVPPPHPRPRFSLPSWRPRAPEPPAPSAEPTPEAAAQPQPSEVTPPLEVKPIKRPTAEDLVEADRARWTERMEERAAGLGWQPRAGEQVRQSTDVATSPVQLSEAQPAEPLPAQEQVERVPWTRRLGELVARLHLRERGRAIAGSVAAGLTVAGRGLASVLQQTLPADKAGPRGRGVNTALMTLAVLIPVAVAVLVATSYTQHSAMEQYQSHLAKARSETTLIASIQAPIERREHWASVMNEANAALAIVPDSAEALQLRDEAQRALDQIDNILRVTPSMLWDFGAAGPHRIAAQGSNLFVLDRTSNRVFQLTLNEAGDGLTDKGEPPTRAYKGQSVGDRQVGDLIDLVWMPQGGTRTRASLVILDTGGLLDYDLAWNLKAVALGQGPVPLGAHSIAAFGGNLYLLDIAAGQVLRYKPQGDGYGTPPENYFDKNLDLSNVVDLAIDGNVYLLQSDGNILKFFGGNEAKFTVSGLTEPIKKPAALAVDAEARQGAVYVADAGLARVVQVTSDGAFTRQVRATTDAFNALEDVLVDEGNGRLFVMSGGRLYVARIPTAP